MALSTPALVLEAWHQEVHARLTPWISVLRDRSRMHMDDGELIIHLETDERVDKRVYEAIKLLVLLGDVDFTLWAFLAQEASVHGPDYIDIEGTRACPIVCTFSLTLRGTHPSTMMDWCAPALLHGLVKESKSLGYDDAKNLLEAGYQVTGNQPNARRQLEIPLRVSTFGYDNVVVLKQCAQVASIQQRRDTSAKNPAQQNALAPPFRLSQISSNVASIVSVEQLELVSQIAAAGVDIAEFCLSGLNFGTKSAAQVARYLQVVTSMATEETNECEGGTIMEIMLTRKMTPRVITALFSALRTSRRVKKLCVDDEWYTPSEGPTMTRADRDQLWQWIGFALFSSFAAHHLELVRLDASHLSNDDVRAFENAVQNPTVLQLPGQEIEFSSPRVIASRFHLSAQGDTALDLPLQKVLVVESGEEDTKNDRVRVLLPGYGLAWVHQDDIRSQMDADIASPEGFASSFLSLTLTRVEDGSLDTVLRLVRAIGHGLTYLAIVGFTCTTALDEWIADVVTACPRLENLIVRSGVHLRSLDVFTQLYENGSLQAKTLGVAEFVVDDWTSVPRLLHHLEDASHEMTKRLHKIAICGGTVPARIPRLLPAIDKMLSANRLLRDMTVQMEYLPTISAEAVGDVKRLYEKHVGQPVAQRREPMDFRAKVAFLSVLAITDTRVMRHVDPPLLALVFEFAAVCEERKLLFRFRTQDTRRYGDEDG